MCKTKLTKKEMKQEQQEALYQLWLMIEDKRSILVNVTNVSSSGMTRSINFNLAYINKDAMIQINNLNYLFSKITGCKLDKKYNLIVKGCGMDMIFSVLFDIKNQINNYQTENKNSESIKSLKIFEKYQQI